MFLPFKISSRSLSFLGYNENVTYQHADADKEEHKDQLRVVTEGQVPEVNPKVWTD